MLVVRENEIALRKMSGGTAQLCTLEGTLTKALGRTYFDGPSKFYCDSEQSTTHFCCIFLEVARVYVSGETYICCFIIINCLLCLSHFIAELVLCNSKKAENLLTLDKVDKEIR